MSTVAALALSASALSACGVFGSGNSYTKPVTTAAVDPLSSRYIRSMIDAGDTGGFWVASNPVEVVNLANNGTPRLSVRPKVSYHAFDVPYPWSAGFRIEPLGDAHAMVVQTEACAVYESYNTSYANGVLSAYSGAHWNLRHAFVPLPPGRPSAMASGLSLYAGLIRWEEVARGSIDHALNWAAPAGTVAQYDFVRPASDTDGIAYKATSRYRLPYGAHLRLRASFDTSHFGPQSAAIAKAMKMYGIYLADTARSDELYNAVPLDGLSHWNASDLSALGSIKISDFQVLTVGPVQRVPGH